MDINGTMMQYFEWDLPADGKLWKQLKEDAAKLKKVGISAVWMPPAYKGAAGAKDVGYGVYDLYDLGEFNQKGSVATKYGTKEEYLAAIQALHDQGIYVYADVVLNHKIGADAMEEVSAKEFNNASRAQMVGEQRTIGAWTRFTFPGRAGKYSDFTWNWRHFDGIDWDQDRAKKAIFCFEGKEWDKDVDVELGNFDYLMGADIDYSNEEVCEEFIRWGKWYTKEAALDGYRLDAVKHINKGFYKNWIREMKEAAGKDLFAVGEYWHWDVNQLQDYIATTEGEIKLFDVPLHFNFHNCSKGHGNYDLRTIFDGTLTRVNPLCAVTFVDNHDSQPGQSLFSWVEDWFKPMAYAMILLRQEGYPCVFYGDYKGIPSSKVKAMKPVLDKLLKVRKQKSYGIQHDYIDDYNCIGWTREGDADHKDSGLAVVLSDGTGGTKHMYIGKHFAGCHFSDVLGNAKYNIKIDENGFGDFYVNRDSIAVWVRKENKR